MKNLVNFAAGLAMVASVSACGNGDHKKPGIDSNTTVKVDSNVSAKVDSATKDTVKKDSVTTTRTTTVKKDSVKK